MAVMLCSCFRLQQLSLGYSHLLNAGAVFQESEVLAYIMACVWSLEDACWERTGTNEPSFAVVIRRSPPVATVLLAYCLCTCRDLCEIPLHKALFLLKPYNYLLTDPVYGVSLE